jgi:hypothetical protein
MIGNLWWQMVVERQARGADDSEMNGSTQCYEDQEALKG